VPDHVAGPIDRDMQRELLIQMRDEYPGSLHFLPLQGTYPTKAIHANLMYLEEHGLCVSSLSKEMVGFSYLGGGRITARGLTS
jgi:hypothetical protein